MKKPVIAIDFDDVVANFNAAYIKYTNKKHGYKMTYDQIITFDMRELYGVSEETVISRVRTFCTDHHHTIYPHPNTQVALRKLRQMYDLHIVTSRCQSLRSVTEQWLASHELNYFSALHFTNGFGSRYPNQKRTKVEVCKEIGAKALIEDAPSNVLAVSKSAIPVLMPNRPWNQGMTGERIIPIRSWDEAVIYLQENI